MTPPSGTTPRITAPLSTPSQAASTDRRSAPRGQHAVTAVDWPAQASLAGVASRRGCPRRYLERRPARLADSDGHLPCLLRHHASRLGVQARGVTDCPESCATALDGDEGGTRWTLARVTAGCARPPRGGSGRGRNVPGEHAAGWKHYGHPLARRKPDGCTVVGFAEPRGPGQRRSWARPGFPARWRDTGSSCCSGRASRRRCRLAGRPGSAGGNPRDGKHDDGKQG